MKFTSSKPRGQRFFKSVTIHSENSDGSKRRIKRPFSIEPIIKTGKPFLWFNIMTGEWEEKGNTSAYYGMSHYGFNDAYSFKAVKRLIAKWNVPKGTKFIASLPYIGYYFFITKQQ